MAQSADQVLSAFVRLSSLGLKSLANRFVKLSLEPSFRIYGIIPDETIMSCLAAAGKFQDSNFLRTIMIRGWSERLPSAVSELRGVLENARRKGGDLKRKQWRRFWYLDMPIDPSIAAEEMLRTLPKEGAGRMKRIAQIVGRLLQARAGPRGVLDTALRLDKGVKLRVLSELLKAGAVQELPCSGLVGALTEPLLSAAEAGDDSLARIIIPKLLKAGVVQELTKAIFKQALRLDKNAKLTVLLSELPFPCSDLVGALTEPLLSAAEAGDDSLARVIISKLLKTGAAQDQTKAFFKQALRLDKDVKLRVLLSEFPLRLEWNLLRQPWPVLESTAIETASMCCKGVCPPARLPVVLQWYWRLNIAGPPPTAGDTTRAHFAQQPRIAGLALQPLPLTPSRCRPVPQGRRDCREARASSATNLRATLLSPRSGARSPRSSGIPQAIVATPVAAISGISSAGGMPSGPPVVRSYAPPRVVVPAWAWLPSPKPACRDPIPGHESGPRRGDVTLLPTPCRVRSQNPTHPKQNATRSACPSFRTGLSGPAIRATLSGAVRARAVVYRVKSLSPPPRKSGYRAVQEG
eukprot:s824_g6.t1